MYTFTARPEDKVAQKDEDKYWVVDIYKDNKYQWTYTGKGMTKLEAENLVVAYESFSEYTYYS